MLQAGLRQTLKLYILQVSLVEVPGVHVLVALMCVYVDAVCNILHLIHQLRLLHTHCHPGSLCGRHLQRLVGLWRQR